MLKVVNCKKMYVKPVKKANLVKQSGVTLVMLAIQTSLKLLAKNVLTKDLYVKHVKKVQRSKIGVKQ